MSWYKEAKSSQKGWTDSLGDVQRYLYDAYDCRVFITKMAHKATVSLTLAHLQYGHVMYQDFWRYSVDEMTSARKTFQQVKTAVDKVFQDFRTNEIPNPSLHSFLREAVRHIDLEHKPDSRIPFVDWARDKDGVKDWRNSIYGNRYPMADGF
jgi:hypothetical protein